MNIYKSRYSFVKKKLYEFGRGLKRMEYSDEYWQRRVDLLRQEEKVGSWNLLIGEYLLRCCTPEERRFIDLYFFQDRTVVNVSVTFSLSERACQNWREEILKNLIGLAVQRQLLRIEI